MLVSILALLVAAVAIVVSEYPPQRPSFIIRRTVVVGGTPSVGTVPNAIPLPVAARARIAESIVRVTGTACQEIQQGSGFVVRPGYVVTDAHVVAGERATFVIDHAGRQLPAWVVRFDPERDLALLRIQSAVAAALPALGFEQPHAPQDLAIFGHPGGGSLRIAPAHLAPSGLLDAQNRDIYQHRIPGSSRILGLAAHLAPGDSGAPVVNTAGLVVAVAFAIDPSGAAVAYARPSADVATVLAPATARVFTGPCVSL